METLFIGRQRFTLDETASTNTFALDLLHNGKLKEGALVVTHKQTQGRGQQKNSWESEPGKNLTLSIVLFPAFLAVSDQFALARITSLAVAAMAEELLKDSGIQIKIKWPNDIYAGNKKIAGILIENVLRDHTIGATVVGIGLNINQLSFQSAPQAISLATLAGKEFDLTYCEEMLCGYLEAFYLKLRAGKQQTIETDYHNKLYRLNELHGFISEGELFQAKITGVSDQGKLKINRSGGNEVQYDLKQIAFVI